jgi:hypothetical protein
MFGGGAGFGRAGVSGVCACSRGMLFAGLKAFRQSNKGLNGADGCGGSKVDAEDAGAGPADSAVAFAETPKDALTGLAATISTSSSFREGGEIPPDFPRSEARPKTGFGTAKFEEPKGLRFGGGVNTKLTFSSGFGGDAGSRFGRGNSFISAGHLP